MVKEPRTCEAEGCDRPAPFGLRLPGAVSLLPPDRRGSFWHCAAHGAEAERWRDAKMEELGMKMPKHEETSDG